MNRLTSPILLLFFVAPFFTFATSSPAANLTFSCSEKSDLYNLVKATGYECSRYGTPGGAIANALPGTGVLVLADRYPETTTPISEADYKLARKKEVAALCGVSRNGPGCRAGRFSTGRHRIIRQCIGTDRGCRRFFRKRA